VSPPSRARTPAPEPPEDPPRGSLPSLGVTATRGSVQVLARGGQAIYSAALVLFLCVVAWHFPASLATLRELSAAITESTKALAAVTAEVRETRALAGRADERSARIEAAMTKLSGEVERLDADVRAGCKR
jgi:hypothetical protein